MKLRNFLPAILLAAVLSGPIAASATASPGGHRTGHQSRRTNNRPKTVHVRSYTKKNGTTVRAHHSSTPR